MLLNCPKCNERLVRNDKVCKCKNGHSFDLAKEGYLNLLLSENTSHGDDKEMVKARTAFLNTGSYSFLKDELCNLIQKENPDVLVDLGCGEGYYTNTFNAKDKYGFDLSKSALKYASKHDKSTQYTVSSIFHVPMPNNCVDTIVTCFAPIASLEIDRLLKKNGCFVVVTPDENHLIELKELLYEEAYKNEVKKLDVPLTKENEIHITNSFIIEKDNILNLFQMTPYAYKTSKEAVEKLKQVEKMKITASFVIRVYRK